MKGLIITVTQLIDLWKMDMIVFVFCLSVFSSGSSVGADNLTPEWVYRENTVIPNQKVYSAGTNYGTNKGDKLGFECGGIKGNIITIGSLNLVNFPLGKEKIFRGINFTFTKKSKIARIFDKTDTVVSTAEEFGTNSLEIGEPDSVDLARKLTEYDFVTVQAADAQGLGGWTSSFTLRGAADALNKVFNACPSFPK